MTNGQMMFFESESGCARATMMVALLALTSCQAPRSVLLPEQAPFVATALRSSATSGDVPGSRVVEVAILPVSRSTGIPDASVSPMREAAYRELVSKGYSALNNQFVDERLSGVDLTLLAGDGAVGAEGQDLVSQLPMGLLQSRIHADSVLSLRALRLDVEEGGRRRISVRATLVAGASGEILFEHTRQRVARETGVTVDDLVGLVREVLTPLPAR